MRLTQPLPHKLLAGVSGGADSVALLHLLAQAGVQVTAVHVNHGLRGEASDGDEAFVADLCNRMNVPLCTYRAAPPENPGEDWARRARYAFFRQAAEETGVHAIALAHHRDDQAETLLMHLLRGSGLTGLCGMAPDTTIDGLRILRPLLAYPRNELQAWLAEIGQPWREDVSNADPRYLRNALRGDVLPRLEALLPGAAERIANTAVLLAEDEAVLHALAEDFLAEHPGDALPIDALRAQPVGLQKRILRAWWVREASPTGERGLSARQTQELLDLLEARASARCNLPACWSGIRGWTHLHLVHPLQARPLQAHPAAQSQLLEVLPFTGDHGDGVTCQVIPRAWLQECTIRSRQAQDFICPFGMSGGQSLQDYFVNRRVDAAFRERVPLLCRGREVLLAGGVGAGRIPRCDEIDDPVLLRWTQAFPWQQMK
ncbi:MAG: tRNA lysidine(34) synthetase TilS [Clostridia bacterium]|nr:tRNA lysidine(34) synthetase TilS [Clostridia bacterium]